MVLGMPVTENVWTWIVMAVLIAGSAIFTATSSDPTGFQHIVELVDAT